MAKKCRFYVWRAGGHLPWQWRCDVVGPGPGGMRLTEAACLSHIPEFAREYGLKSMKVVFCDPTKAEG